MKEEEKGERKTKEEKGGKITEIRKVKRDGRKFKERGCESE